MRTGRPWGAWPCPRASYVSRCRPWTATWLGAHDGDLRAPCPQDTFIPRYLTGGRYGNGRGKARPAEGDGGGRPAPGVEGVRRAIGHAHERAGERGGHGAAQAQGGPMSTTRTRGLGSVYLRRGTTWWVKFYVDGKAKRESS